MTDFSHLNAIQGRIYREEQRLAAATNTNEKAFREHEIMMAKREEAAEYAFLGIIPAAADNMTDEEILAELLA